MARLRPMGRGSRCRPPASAARPTRGSGRAKVAFSGSDDEVAGQRNLEAAAHGDAVHRRDERLVTVEARGQAGEARGVPAALAAGGLVHLRSLPAQNASVAGAGDDRHPLLGIAGEVVEHLVQLVMRIGVQCVVNLRTRQRHDGDRSLAGSLAENFRAIAASLLFFVSAEFMTPAYLTCRA